MSAQTAEDIARMNEDMRKAGEDHTKPSQGAAKLPADGACLARFVEYIEFGLQKSRNPEYKDARECQLTFEIVSKRHNIDNNGKITHPRIPVTVNKSTSAKGNFLPLMRCLNYVNEKGAVITQFLGGAYKSRIYHEKSADGTKTYARLKTRDSGWNFTAPIQEDPEDPTNNTPINVAPAKSPLKCFVWEPAVVSDEHYLQAWDNLFIEGVYDDGNSKNRLQEKIMKNLEWEGSRLQRLIEDRKKGVPDLDVDDGAEEDIPY